MLGGNKALGSLVGVCSFSERAGVALPPRREPAQPHHPAPRSEGQSPGLQAESPVLAKPLLGVQHGNVF